MVVKRCTTKTVLGMLNQAAKKFIFTLETNYHGFGGTYPLCSPLWMYVACQWNVHVNAQRSSLTLLKVFSVSSTSNRGSVCSRGRSF